ncbi:hypothetical protein [Sphaerisporangium perillae]|uniref:hypothetical protein n=1 Tax=Sphaerisporangium perillae TaxID=2935860 RepID=UPI00200FD597|nr:hypothetical protein [Sphaerisporangium perillae]
MARFVMRVLAPLRVRRAVLGRFDARYVTRADHRQDVRDALWEVQAVKREIEALRREVEQLRKEIRRGTSASPGAAAATKAEEALRLATETASAVDHLLQEEIRLWQAIDGIREDGAAPIGEGAAPVDQGAAPVDQGVAPAAGDAAPSDAAPRGAAPRGAAPKRGGRAGRAAPGDEAAS